MHLPAELVGSVIDQSSDFRSSYTLAALCRLRGRERALLDGLTSSEVYRMSEIAVMSGDLQRVQWWHSVRQIEGVKAWGLVAKALLYSHLLIADWLQQQMSGVIKYHLFRVDLLYAAINSREIDVVAYALEKYRFANVQSSVITKSIDRGDLDIVRLLRIKGRLKIPVHTLVHKLGNEAFPLIHFLKRSDMSTVRVSKFVQAVVEGKNTLLKEWLKERGLV